MLSDADSTWENGPKGVPLHQPTRRRVDTNIFDALAVFVYINISTSQHFYGSKPILITSDITEIDHVIPVEMFLALHTENSCSNSFSVLVNSEIDDGLWHD